jgi:hypothetical protein
LSSSSVVPPPPVWDWQDPHHWFFYNLEVPNERGYDVIRRLFLTAIAKSWDQIK